MDENFQKRVDFYLELLVKAGVVKPMDFEFPESVQDPYRQWAEIYGDEMLTRLVYLRRMIEERLEGIERDVDKNYPLPRKFDE